AEDGIRDFHVTGVQTCALPIFARVSPILCRSAKSRISQAPWRVMNSAKGAITDVPIARQPRAGAGGRCRSGSPSQNEAITAGRRSEERRVGQECRTEE